MPRLFPKDDADFEVTVSTHSIVRFILLVLLAILLLAAVRKSAHTLTLIGVSFFLALALDAPVRWLARHLPGKSKGSRSLATALSIIAILVVLGGFFAAIVPPLARQTTTFIQNVPQLVEDTQNGDGPIGNFVTRYHLQSEVQSLSSELSKKTSNIGGSALHTVSRVGTSLFSVLAVMAMTVMMLVEGPAWRKIFTQLVPSRRRPRLERLGHDMNRVIQGYVNGQVLLAGIAAVLIVPMLFILHVSYPLALMVVVFICGLIPMVGHTIGAIICTTVALFTSLPAAIVLLSYYILYQQIENYAVQPRIQANSTNMSPLLVFVSVLVGANFGGLLGGLVAIPVAGCIRIALLDYLEDHDILTKSVAEDAKTQGGNI